VDLPEAIIDGRYTGVVVRTDGCHEVDRRPGRSPGADKLEEFVRGGAEFYVRKEQMLVEVAGRHRVLGIVLVEESLPLPDFRDILRLRRLQDALLGGSRSLRPLVQPPGHEVEFLLLQRGEAERHPVVRVLFKICREFASILRTGQVVRFGIVTAGAFRIPPLVVQELKHHRVVEPVADRAFRHAEKVFFPPLRGVLRVGEQAGGIHRLQAGGVIDGFFRGSPVRPFIRVQLELAGGVVARVADRAAFLQQGLYFREVMDRPCRDIHCNRRKRLRCAAGKER
jgi:hypothetical protein